MKSCQTIMKRQGGCWVGSNAERVKAIKSVGTAIAWASIAKKFVPVHVVTCYVEPGQNK